MLLGFNLGLTEEHAQRNAADFQSPGDHQRYLFAIYLFTTSKLRLFKHCLCNDIPSDYIISNYFDFMECLIELGKRACDI